MAQNLDEAMVLEVESLSKKFSSLKAVNELSFQIQKGQVLGLLGPNGSGKTTTLAMLLGVTRPSGGSFNWFGEGRSAHLRRRIGSLLERPRFYPWMSGKESLKLTASLRGAAFAEISDVLARVGLADVGRKKVGQYSLGMKQRLGLAACLLGSPEVLVLDEPTNGMDPQGIADIRDLIKTEQEAGKTIILASHILGEVEKVCSHVLMLNKGQLISGGPLNEVIGGEKWFEIRSSSNEKLKEVLRKHPQFQSLEQTSRQFIRVSFKTELGGDEVNRFCFDQGLCLSELIEKHQSLEQNFLEALQADQGSDQGGKA